MDSSPDLPCLVEDTRALEELCRSLTAQQYVALDTEFVRVRTFYPKLCLVQTANEHALACIDVLAVESLDPLLQLLFDPAVTKVMHAARQDLELIYHLTGQLPGPLFDTQVAASLLGFDEQAGYASLVEELLDIRLDKAHTRTDWARRPLRDEQLHYAADDVRYLVDLYRVLRDRLLEQGRLEWATTDSQALVNPELYRVNPQAAWRRIRSSRKLRGPQRAAMKRLAAWREREAMRRDRPRQWIVRDELLHNLARRLPESRRQLAALPGMPRPLLERYSGQLLEEIRAARLDGKPVASERPADAAAVSPADQDTLQDLMRALRNCGEKHKISPSALATRKELKKLLRGERDLSVLRGWRYDIVGRELLELIEGR